jgi:hypothetical protein
MLVAAYLTPRCLHHSSECPTILEPLMPKAMANWQYLTY